MIRRVVLIFACTLTLSACSNRQLGHFVHDVCKGWENCTVYDDEGKASRDWDPETRRDKVRQNKGSD